MTTDKQCPDSDNATQLPGESTSSAGSSDVPTHASPGYCRKNIKSSVSSKSN